MSDSDDFEDEALDTSAQTNIRFSSKDVFTQPVKQVAAPVTEEPPKEDPNLKELQTRNLSPEIVKYLEAVKQNEYDREAWVNLASSLRDADLDGARNVFKVILDHFPGSGHFLRMYCDVETRAHNYAGVEALLRDNMMKCASTDVFVYYCHYYEKKLLYGKAGAELLNARNEVEKVYLYAIKTVGHFIDSDVLFRDYKAFLERQPRNSEDGSYTKQCIASWRSFFQHVVSLPIRNVDVFWEDYSKFEASQVTTPNMTAEEKKRAIIAALSGSVEAYKLASTVYKKREEVWKDIDLKRFAIRNMSDADFEQLSLWRKAIDFEAANLMKLPSDVLHNQMTMVYRRCLGCCYYAPDVWLNYAAYESQFNWKITESILNDAIQTMPNCVLLRLAIADYYESNNRLDDAKRVYEEMIDTLVSPEGWIGYQQFVRRTQGIKQSREIFHRSRFALLKPEQFIAAAHLEGDVNRQVNSALNIYRSGLAFFSKDEEYILSYVRFLLEHKQIENARTLLQNSIQLIGMDHCTSLWDMLLSLQNQYDMRVTSLNELKMTEERFVKTNEDRKMFRGMMGRMKRYLAQGFEPQSKEDKSLVLRRSFMEQELEMRSKRQAMDIGKLNIAIVTGTSDTPTWMLDIMAKLPKAEKDLARATVVNQIISILPQIKIPKASMIIVKKWCV